MTYLITGSNRGLGLELTRDGIRRGFDIVASCRTASEELSALAEEYPNRVFIQHMDVADTASVERASEETAKKCGSLNGFINNAAVLYGSKYDTRDPITTIDLAEAEDTLNINILGVIRVMKFFMPLVYQAKGDRCVVNITSEGAVLKETGHQYAVYGASKCALNGYTQRMRNYLASREDTADIRMYMIHPGRMFTVMGKENAQIQPSESSGGIWDLICRINDVYSTIPFFDYRGKPMPQRSDN
jgi:NAD(P)-dependent dehydrogenase (short-subunit alcohol dehydrogenase family)